MRASRTREANCFHQADNEWVIDGRFPDRAVNFHVGCQRRNCFLQRNLKLVLRRAKGARLKFNGPYREFFRRRKALTLREEGHFRQIYPDHLRNKLRLILPVRLKIGRRSRRRASEIREIVGFLAPTAEEDCTKTRHDPTGFRQLWEGERYTMRTCGE